LLSATGNENNDSHRQYPHYHTDRTKVTGTRHLCSETQYVM